MELTVLWADVLNIDGKIFHCIFCVLDVLLIRINGADATCRAPAERDYREKSHGIKFAAYSAAPTTKQILHEVRRSIMAMAPILTI